LDLSTTECNGAVASGDDAFPSCPVDGRPTLIPALVPLNAAPVLTHLLRSFSKAGGSLDSAVIVCNAQNHGRIAKAMADAEVPGTMLLSSGATGPHTWKGEAADLGLAMHALGDSSPNVLVVRGNVVVTQQELLESMMAACTQRSESIAVVTELEPHMPRTGQVLVLMRKPVGGDQCRRLISTASGTDAEVGDEVLIGMALFRDADLPQVVSSGASSIEGMVAEAVWSSVRVAALPLSTGYFSTATLPELQVTQEVFRAAQLDPGGVVVDVEEAAPAATPAGGGGSSWIRRAASLDPKEEEEEDDDGVILARDENFLGFERDMPGRGTVVFSKHEEARMQKYEGIQYYNPNSKTYRKWLSFQIKNGSILRDQWIVTMLVGILGGLTAWALAMCYHSVGHYRVHLDDGIVQAGQLFKAWAVGVAFSAGLMLIATVLVVMVAPTAAGAGIAEVVAYLNGVDVPNFMTGKVFIVKFLSCSAAVASGAPVGPEGPIIHMGAILGSFVSQGQSAMLKCSSNLFTTLRNSRDRRDFITLGVAVGVAAAFKAPVGGLLFTYEEVASHWNVYLTWKIFVGCVIAVLTRQMMDGWVYLAGQEEGTSPFSQLVMWNRFDFETDLASIAIMVLGTCIIGILCGCLAVPFTFINTRMARLRAVWLSGRGRWVPWARMAEPMAVIVVWTTIALVLPFLFPPSPTVCQIPASGHGAVVCPDTMTAEQKDLVSLSLRWPGNCSEVIAAGATPWPAYISELQDAAANISGSLGTDSSHHRRHLLAGGGGDSSHGEDEELVPFCHSGLATLLRLEGTVAFEMVLSHSTSGFFSVPVLLVAFALVYIFAALMAGSAISTGLFIPMMYIGAIVGRLVGIFMRELAEMVVGDITLQSPGGAWVHVDPGVFAGIGAVAYVSGVTRLTLSIAVILSEITGTSEYMLLMVGAISIAKFIADYATHALYHTLIEIKCMPHLPQLKIHTASELDLIPITQLMHSPPVVILEEEPFCRLHEVLESTSHNCFPVVRKGPMGGVLIGTMLRRQLEKLLALAEGINPQPQEDMAAYQSLVDTR